MFSEIKLVVWEKPKQVVKDMSTVMGLTAALSLVYVGMDLVTKLF